MLRNGSDLQRSDIVAESELLISEEIGMSFEVQASRDVWIMPVTFDKGVQRQFELTCYSSFAVQFG